MIENVQTLKNSILKLIDICFTHYLMIDILDELDWRNIQLRDEIINETEKSLPVRTQKYVLEHYKTNNNKK